VSGSFYAHGGRWSFYKAKTLTGTSATWRANRLNGAGDADVSRVAQGLTVSQGGD
jgi:hypothetical protein